MLPKFQGDDRNFNMLQTQWAEMIDPALRSPIVQGRQINGVTLINGVNTINHKLGEKLRGWIVVGINGIASIYDSQATNANPNLTLVLTSSAAVTVNLWVY